MARVYRDRVMQKITTAGTGNLDLGDDFAIDGFTRFNALALSDGDTFDYAVFAVDGTGAPTGEWETGEGEWDSFEIIRTPQRGSAGDATLVDFAAGDKYIMLSHNAASLEAGGGGGGGALVKIGEAVGDGVSGALQVLSIPSTYDSLVIEFSGRVDEAVDERIIYFAFSTFSGGHNYSRQMITAAGATVTADEVLAGFDYENIVVSVPGSTAPTDAQGSVVVEVPNYAGGGMRTFTAQGGCQIGTGTGEIKRFSSWGTSNTTEAIEAVTFGSSGGPFTADTKLVVYGRGG